MNIGIMSMQRVINYGSFLQAYGLKKTLEGMGHSVQFVDYKIEPALVDEVIQDKNSVNPLKRILNMFSSSYRVYRREQLHLNQSFDSFRCAFESEYFSMLGLSKTPNLCPALDLLVIGSDEVFNCTQPGSMVGYSRQLFGMDNCANKVVSYAASFGYTTLERLEKYQIDEEVGQLLSKFDALSVRDENSKTIVQKLTGIKSSRHIDPVLLYPFEEVEDYRIPMCDYIIVYAYSGRITDEESRAIRKFADEQNKRIITLGYYQPFCDDFVLASPLEVLAYIKNADYVITDTFHGTVFSIKYGKQFGTIIRDSNRNKLHDLLCVFDLQNRQIENLDLLPEVVLAKIDSEALNKRIENERQCAIKYLSDCVEL